MSLENRALDGFAGHFGRNAEGVSFAPGRVNLIGEHVDYNDGLVLPMPVREGTAVAWARRDDGKVRVHAADMEASDCFQAENPERPGQVGWQSYVRGMASTLAAQGAGCDLLVTGNLPRGSGLSSSASLCIAVGRALADVGNTVVDPVAMARAAQETEHEWAGVACGIMDQMAVAAGTTGHAMLLDCRNLDFVQIAVPQDWAVLVVESGVTRGLVDGEYNARRRQCEAAARALGLPSLRGASAQRIEAARAISDTERRRALHVVTEIARVEAFAEAMKGRDLRTIGSILREGHASLRDLFEVSVPAVDMLVDELNSMIGDEGGARMTGAGFGGAVVAVLPADIAEALSTRIDMPMLRAW